ncbi:Isochorismatase-like protein [Lipomyces doorenjongii]
MKKLSGRPGLSHVSRADLVTHSMDDSRHDCAHDAEINVVYVTVSFRRCYPDVSSRNMMFAHIPSAGRYVDGDPSIEIHPDVAPCVLVTKRRVSAFTPSDLDVLLRSLEVESLVLAGVATSGVVLSTVRQAADLDFRVSC